MIRNLLGEDLGPLNSKELESLERQLDMSLQQIRSTRVLTYENENARYVRCVVSLNLDLLIVAFCRHKQCWIPSQIFRERYLSLSLISTHCLYSHSDLFIYVTIETKPIFVVLGACTEWSKQESQTKGRHTCMYNFWRG